MSALRDLTGMRFGQLTVICRTDNINYTNGRQVTSWLCKCDCGTTKIINRNSLVSGHSKSCGCKAVKHGRARKERLYNIWVGMKQRCRDTRCSNYQSYGGRGISVCEEWELDYLAFREWALSNGYTDHLTIDRINVDGNYCSENCRWSTSKEQNNNTTRNRVVLFEGSLYTMSEFANIIGLPYRIVNGRMHQGWAVERIASTPVGRYSHDS